MFLRILVVACFALSVAQAQDIQYVNAENGLVIREQPNQGAAKIGILDYGTAVEIIEHTNLHLDVKDNDKKVSGKWVKIKGPAVGEYFEDGYVFNGYLTEEKIEQPLKIAGDTFTIYIDKLQANVQEQKPVVEDETAASVFKLNNPETIENRYLKVKHHQNYRTIEVLQRHRNSIAVQPKDGEAAFTDFQHYTSSWKPLKLEFPKGNIYKTATLSAKDSKRFGSFDKAELYSTLSLEDSATYSIAPSQIELKVIMTDIDGYKTEKIVIFELPLGKAS
ncbi:SH3 domain-containing protein [Winogradskyella wandonensis]|uniref:SH3 domain-containing protein n=1 Tax=Winogradskyella wandonensis TaxID=1442586 RepID=A0A4R1KTZ5_9FLAO|nr:SH3 domain-containing protein [Winogradskyella wandonensis]TCK68010.1 SH3 domain-containing protein [Winogradskyella wandonensis]